MFDSGIFSDGLVGTDVIAQHRLMAPQLVLCKGDSSEYNDPATNETSLIVDGSALITEGLDLLDSFVRVSDAYIGSINHNKSRTRLNYYYNYDVSGIPLFMVNTTCVPPDNDGTISLTYDRDSSGSIVYRNLTYSLNTLGDTIKIGGMTSNMMYDQAFYTGAHGLTMSNAFMWWDASNVLYDHDSIMLHSSNIKNYSGQIDYLHLKNKPGVTLYSDISGVPVLKTVATSGLYSDISGVPVLKAVATSGLYSDISGTPVLKTIATSGLYSDLSGVPVLKTIATSGLYSDLSGVPLDGVFNNVTVNQVLTLSANTEHVDSYGSNRFYFAGSSDTYLQSPTGFVFQQGIANYLLTVTNTGALQVKDDVWHISRDGQKRVKYFTSSNTAFSTGKDYTFQRADEYEILKLTEAGNMTVGNNATGNVKCNDITCGQVVANSGFYTLAGVTLGSTYATALSVTGGIKSTAGIFISHILLSWMPQVILVLIMRL
jgi:hypothetical protein